MTRFRHSLIGPALLLVSAPVVAQGVWSEVDRLPLASVQQRLDSDGDRLLLCRDYVFPPAQTYVFRREAGTWVPEETLPVYAAAGAIDGSRLALAAAASVGSVDVYELGAGGWSLTQSLPAPRPGGSFGRGLDLEGDVLVVGDAQATQRSAVYVYRRGPGGWVLLQSLLGPFANGNDGFGLRVALSDGHLAVGAQGVGRGSVFVYEGGPEGFGLATELPGDASGRAFGAELALRGDSLLVSDPGCLPPCLNGPFGRVVFFERVGGEWLEIQRIADPLSDPDNGFGRGVALGPGVACVSTIGGLGLSNPEPRLHVFHRLGGRWRQTGLLGQPPPISIGPGTFGSGITFAGTELFTFSLLPNGAGTLHVFAPDIRVSRSPSLPASR